MSRLTIMTATNAQRVIEDLYKDLERRIIASPPGLCPVDMASAFLKLCHAQTCGKCVPCRIGLAQLQMLLEDVLEGRAALSTIDLIEKTAQNISWSADCAIGQEAVDMVLKGVQGFRDDYEEHILHGRCTASLNQPVPCVSMCPAGVDIPGYIALVKEGRNAGAVRLIRKVVSIRVKRDAGETCWMIPSISAVSSAMLSIMPAMCRQSPVQNLPESGLPLSAEDPVV